MKIKSVKNIETPYLGVSEEQYQIEKRRLQVELLKIQQELMREGRRLAIVFEGRDAAGKGSTIKRFTENMVPAHARVVALGIPSLYESKHWFRRYEKHFPKPGEAVFFDRSWYSRALIEPTMGYCSEAQYKYFMRKVLDWEHKHMDTGLFLVKFYLSISKDTQLVRFEDRIANPLTYWKFSKNDIKARKKWEKFTSYKEQMFAHAASQRSPWVIVNANKKSEARLTCMLHLVRLLGDKNFRPLTGKDINKTHTIKLGGVKFRGLSMRQLAVLEQLQDQDQNVITLEVDET